VRERGIFCLIDFELLIEVTRMTSIRFNPFPLASFAKAAEGAVEHLGIVSSK
jgi:hypothetical protein